MSTPSMLAQAVVEALKRQSRFCHVEPDIALTVPVDSIGNEKTILSAKPYRRSGELDRHTHRSSDNEYFSDTPSSA